MSELPSLLSWTLNLYEKNLAVKRYYFFKTKCRIILILENFLRIWKCNSSMEEN
jgi:hypothetical protein